MFGIGSTEILMIVTTLLLLATPVVGLIILYSIYKYYAGDRERKLDARVEELEKRLGERQKK